MFYPIHKFRRGYFQNLIEGRGNIVDVVELGADLSIVLDLLGPGDHQRGPGSTHICSHQLGTLKRRCTRIGPSMVIHNIEFWSAQRVHSAVFLVEDVNMLFNGGWHAILSQQFRDSSVHAF